MTRRIVVAEDEAIIRLDLIESLRSLGHDVVGEASDGAQAVELAARLQPDVVLLDVAMPVMDGLTAAEAIIAQDGPAVVMVTAFSQEQVVQRAAEAGALGYLVKPFTPADLGPAISIAIARREQMRQLTAEADDARDRLAARIIVDRAKGRLQADRGMSEDEAFGWLRKRAMDTRMSLTDVAKGVLEG